MTEPGRFPRTWAEIDLGAIEHNLAEVRTRVGPHTLIGLVCKADAYGHGLVPVGRFAARHGADWLCVAAVQEGVALRDAGVTVPTMVMSPTLPDEASQAVFYGLDIFVESAEAIREFASAAEAQSRVARLHLKVDTGLHRFGAAPANVPKLIELIERTPGCILAGVAQHFADAGNRVLSDAQSVRFAEIMECIPPDAVIHMSGSGAAARYPDARQGLVRIGMHAYGIDAENLYEGRLVPAMRWFARVSSIRDIGPGEGVSYLGTWLAQRPSRIATLAVGYGDGYARSASNRAYVEIGGRAPVVGMVCMDQVMIDVTDLPHVKVGDVAELLGNNIRVPELATWSQTNGHEVVSRLMTRVNRRYLFPEST